MACVYNGEMHALAVSNLVKTYRNGVQALKGIDLEVEEGDFFALLGPNGAGKTTLIGIVTSLVNKTGGAVSVFGHDIDRELDGPGIELFEFVGGLDDAPGYPPIQDLVHFHGDRGLLVVAHLDLE